MSTPTRPDPSGRSVAAAPARLGLLVLCSLLVLAACTAGSPARVTIPPDATASTAPARTGSPAPPPDYPMTLVDDEGRDVVLPAEPGAVVSLTPATTEILFAVGAGERVVATTDFDDFPPEAIPLPDVANFSAVDVERIVDLEADLVIAGGNGFNPPDDLERLRSLGIPVLVTYAPDIDGVLADIALVGRAVGRAAEARDLADGLRAELAAIEAATSAAGSPPRVFYELDATREIYGPAPDSFIEEMIVLAGGDPITTADPAVFSIPLERLVAADPEVIVLGDAAYGVTAEAVAARPGWGDMTAVRAGAIRPVDDIVVTRPGPRLAEGLRALAQAIHPDLELPPPGTAP